MKKTVMKFKKIFNKKRMKESQEIPPGNSIISVSSILSVSRLHVGNSKSFAESCFLDSPGASECVRC